MRLKKMIPLVLCLSVALALVQKTALASDPEAKQDADEEQEPQDVVDQPRGTIVFNKKVVLKRKSDEQFARLRFMHTLVLKDKKGEAIKELTVRCEMISETMAPKVIILAHGKSHAQWQVHERTRKGTSWEQIVFRKSDIQDASQDIKLTCMSSEREGDDAKPVTLVPALMNKALEKISAKVYTDLSTTIRDMSAPASTEGVEQNR